VVVLKTAAGGRARVPAPAGRASARRQLRGVGLGEGGAAIPPCQSLSLY
jgi:hypothetical protein